MEMNRTELAAVNGVACDLLDAQGRMVVSPNALTVDGQSNVPADLQPGENLAMFLDRHVPSIASGAWTVSIGGLTVPQTMWRHTFPKHGQVIACRAVLRKDVLRLAAMAALTYFTVGFGAATAGMWGAGAVAGAYGAAAAFGVQMAGSMLINKVLGPKVPAEGNDPAKREIYRLNSQRNSARANERLPVLWGEMRVTPDLAGQPYAWFEGEDQYLSTILLGGVNVHSAFDLTIGDTALTSFEEVSTFFNGFSGMPSQDVPLYGNADSIAGGELENDGSWVTRTSSVDTIALQVDIEGQLFDVDGKGNVLVNSVPLFIETRLVGTEAWQAAHISTLSNATRDVFRRTIAVSVASGQYEVRVRLGKPTYDEDNGKDACKLAWNVLKSIQPDATNYSGWGRIGIKIKATGQISGSLDTLRATYRARPLPVWNGSEWITATTRAEGLSNPGAIILQTLRGVYGPDPITGEQVLQFGFGMSDEQIDIEGLKAFMLHCTARGYTYDRWLTSDATQGAFCDEVALAGMGEFSWTDGGRPTAVFVSSGQPLSGVVNMANMLKGSFSVDYTLSNAADGIEYQYVDRDRKWETNTVRVTAPGVTAMRNPARITGEGVTTEAHAAVLARYHLAQSLYQYKTIDYGADIEHLAYRRLSVLSISHDLTQWGYGGRVMAAGLNAAGKVELQLDEPVPPMAQAYVGLRVPGARDYRVFKVEALESESEWVTLVEPWPEDLAFPGEDLDNPAHDTLWCYDFKATPGYRVRVVGMQPEADLKGAQVTCVPEGPEFWDYVLNGTYTPAPNQSSLPQLGRPKVSNLRITEKVNVQGDTEWYSLSLVWDVEGDYDHAQVWAGRDGSELRLVDGNAVGSRAEFRIDGAGEWLVEVRPFNASGLVGQAATVLYITTQTQLPPRNVDEFVVQNVAGGLRRFAWLYAGDRPPAFTGVQIRYAPGDVPLSVADWEGMQPLGEADDIYSAQFETTRPQAGLWTFGCRAIDTAGQLANGVVRFVASLEDSFEQVQQPDMTPPPAVTGLTAEGMLANVQANWDVATYTVGHGHARTIIYAAQGENATFAQAEQVAEAFGGLASFGSEPATTWKIWAKHQTVDGVLSQNPSQPVTVTTGQDAEKLLEVLQGQLTESQLHQDLAQEIELISGAGVGSVNARLIAEAQARAQAVALEAQARAQDLAAEAQARAAALAAEAQARGQGITGEAQARAAAVQAEAAARQAALAQVTADLQAASSALQGNIDAVNAQVADIIGAGEYDAAKAYESGQLVKRQGKLYRSKSAVPAGNPPPAAAYWVLVGDYDSIGEAVAAHAAQLSDHSVRIGQTEQGLTAEATSRNALAVQLRGNYTGADLGQVTSGLVWSERQARVTGDSANASAIQAVSARMPSGTGAVAAAADVVAEQQARVAGDGANATAIQAVTARMPAGSGKVATEASVTDETTARASGDSALASRAALIEARLPAGTGQLATTAQVVAEEQARVAGDGANASLIQGVRTDLTSTQGTVGGQGTAISGLQSSVTSINGALTSQAGSISQLQASVGSASTGLQALNALGSESEWIRRAGNPAANLSTKVEATAAAGAVLVLGANSGNDGVFVQHSATLPLDESRLYKFKTRYRRTAGGATGPIYAGIIAMGAGKTTFINPENVETPVLNSGHYAVLGHNPPVNNWITVEYYYKGRSAGASTGNGTKASPRTFANKTAHLALIFAGNYPNLPGICELDFITFEDVTDVERISADATTEAIVRADADSALASRATLLEARMPVGTGQLATASALQSLDSRVAAAEGVNQSQSTSLTTLTNTLNGLEVGGANLYAMKANKLVNEQGIVTATWLAEDWVRLTVVSLNAAGTAVLTRFDDCFVATDHVIEAGKLYSVSAEVLLPVTTPVSFYTYIGGVGGPITGRAITQSVANKWAQIAFEGVVSRGAATAGTNSLIAIGFSGITSDFIGKSFEIRNLMVEPGNKKTAYGRPAALVAASINAKADSSALATLDSKVTGQGDTIASQASSLTSLTNKVNHATTGLDSKASSAALASLDSKVTTQGETITSQGTALTTLTNNLSALSGVVDSKASSAALSSLQSTVTEQGSAITSQGSSIISLAQSLETAAAVAATGSVHIGTTEPFGGRRNVHTNPSFERTGVQNMIATYSGAVATIEQSPGAAAGNAVLQVVRGAAGTGLFGMIYALPAPSGTAFSARFKIRLKPGTPSRSIFVTAASYTSGAGGAWAKTGTGNGSRTLTDQWQEIVFAGFTQSSGNAAGLQLASNGTWAAGDGVQIDMVLAEAAETPGVWFDPFDMLWIDTTGGANTPKRFNGAAWLASSDKVATDAAAAAAAAQATANTKADASALASLQSTVTQQGTTITSQGGSITTLTNSVSAIDQIVTIRDTRNDNSPPSFYWANYPRRTVREFKFRSVIGAPGSSSYGALETTARWTDASGGPVVQVFTPGESLDQYTRYSTSTTAWSAWSNAVRDLQTVVGTKADATAVQALTNRVTAAEGGITSIGGSVTSLTNRIADAEGVNAGQAASIGTLDNRVTLAEGKIESQASSVTALTSSLASTRDSNSLLPDYLSANAGEWVSGYSTPLAPFFKTTTTGKIGPNVVRKEGITNFWNYSKTWLPNDRAYRLSMWVRRSAEANGSTFFNAERISPSGASLGNSYVAVSPQVTADGEWSFVSTTWDLRSVAATAPRLAFGFAINHGQANGWAEMQGFKVTEVLSAADVDASLATAAALTSLTTRVASTEAMNTSQSTSITSLTNSLSSLTSVVDTKASSSALATLDSKVTQQGNTIISQGSSITSLANTIDNSSTGLASKASAAAVSSLTTRVVSAEGLISSHTEQINQVQATAAGNSSAIQQNASAQADINGYVAAQYSMKVQVASNGKTAVGGMAVQGTSNGTAGPTIDFGVMASTFWVAAPAGSGLTSANLFIVRTAATTINGQPVPAGTYFADAFIGNGTITSAKIGKLQVDDGHVVSLSVAKLVAGSLAVGQYIQSTGYVAGSDGWRINANGIAEFSGVIVRGTIHATAGSIGTFNINANGLNSGGYVGYGWPNGNATGVHISHNGILIGNPSVGRYLQITETGNLYTPHLTIENGNATFGGRLNAASGTFSGSMTAQAVNAVNTINIAGNAVTVPVGGTGYGSVPGYWVSMPQGGAIIAMVAANYIAESTHGQATVSLAAKIGDITGPGVAISLANLYSGSATAMFKLDVGPGSYYVTGVISFSIGIRTIAGTSLAAFGAQR